MIAPVEKAQRAARSEVQPTRIRKKDGLPFYEGEAKSKKLKQLAVEANENHKQAESTKKSMLEYARAAGEALNEAYRICGRRKKWSAWRNANFKGSARTCQIYRRIARKWDDPRIEAVRQSGLEIDSIRGFTAALDGKKLKPEQAKPEDDSPADDPPDDLYFYRKELRAAFINRTARLKDRELKLLYVTMFNGLNRWENLFTKFTAAAVAAAAQADENAKAYEDSMKELFNDPEREEKRRRRKRRADRNRILSR